MTIGQWYLFTVIASSVLDLIADRKVEYYIKRNYNPTSEESRLKMSKLNLTMRFIHIFRSLIPVVNIILATKDFFKVEEEKENTEKLFLENGYMTPKDNMKEKQNKEKIEKITDEAIEKMNPEELNKIIKQAILTDNKNKELLKEIKELSQKEKPKKRVRKKK